LGKEVKVTEFLEHYYVQPEGVAKVEDPKEDKPKVKAKGRKLTHTVKGMKIHDEVWALVKKLCKGNVNPRLLEIRSEIDVVIHNSEDWKARREANHKVQTRSTRTRRVAVGSGDAPQESISNVGSGSGREPSKD
jgi:hypothetical protein